MTTRPDRDLDDAVDDYLRLLESHRTMAGDVLALLIVTSRLRRLERALVRLGDLVATWHPPPGGSR